MTRKAVEPDHLSASDIKPLSARAALGVWIVLSAAGWMALLGSAYWIF